MSTTAYRPRYESDYEDAGQQCRITEDPSFQNGAQAKAEPKKPEPDFGLTKDDLRRIVLALDWSARNLKVFGFNLTDATAKEVTELARQLDDFWARYEGPFTDFVLVAKER